MDIVTHGITGVLVSRALPGGDKGPMMMAGLMGALAPDLDVIARLWDPMAAITVHRTATHSFLGGAVIAVVVAGLVWGLRQESFLRLFGFAYLGLLSHIGLDLLTSFGTAILWPLTNRRFALALFYVIDPIFSMLAVGFLMATFRLKEKKVSLAKIGLLGILLYVLVAAAYQRIAFSRWQVLLNSQGISPMRSSIIPLFPGPMRWLGVAETAEAFYQQPFWLYGSASEPPRHFPKANENPAYAEQVREVKLFLNFARFPWRHVWTEGAFRIVEYRELAFADHPLGGPLSLRIWLDESNSVRKVELGHRF